MGHTTDNAAWDRPMRPQNPQYNPKEFVRDIVVPMLVIHGDKDYCVPIAQGHASGTTCTNSPRRRATPRTHPPPLLYFPDEGH